MNKLKVLSVNISEKKGTIKLPVPSITLTENGVEGDAHSGPWNRQVSMLGIGSIRKSEMEAGRKINYGEFAENITTEGIDLWKCHPLDRFVSEEVELEVTQIGKECHGTSCSIFKEVGNCVMPKEGIFARVITPGALGSRFKVQGSSTEDQESSIQHPASSIQHPASRIQHPASSIQHPASLTAGISLDYVPKVYSARIITLSDRAFKGEYEDKSGPRVKELLEDFFNSHENTKTQKHPDSESRSLDPRPSTLDPSPHVSRLTSHVVLLPDDPDQLRSALQEAIDADIDFIFTTGGTGIGHRDFTPDVVKPMFDKEIPGIMEMIRIKYGAEKHQALLSRGVAGVTGNTLIFTLPGSVKAVNEYMQEIGKSLMHMVYMLNGLDAH